MPSQVFVFLPQRLPTTSSAHFSISLRCAKWLLEGLRGRRKNSCHSCVGSTQLSRPTLWTTERLRKKLPLRGSQFDNSLLLFCSWWFILLLLISRTQDLYSWTSRQTVNLVTNSPVFSLMCSLFWSCMKSLLLTVVCFSDWQWRSSCCLVCRKVYDIGYVRNPIRN
jgi:hypothetical protein